MNDSYINKVNAITLSRILLTVLGVMLIFSGNIKLLVVAYIIMSFSEVSDIIDGYVARRDNLVTDLGKILDPLSDSISRFFYFFALAYHGLFPIWFMVFFFLRDIIVAYIRIFASFSGTVMSARFSGKLKGGVQFAGQYLLMYALMINTVQQDGKLTGRFISIAVITGILLNVGILLYFKIRGNLLAVILTLMPVLSLMLVSVNYINITINYLTTFIIAFFVISVTLFSLSDYLFSLVPHVKNIYNVLTSTILILLMFIISPYFLDLIKNKIESGAQKSVWQSYDIINIEKTDGLKVRGIVSVDSLVIVAASRAKKLSRLYVYKDISGGSEFLFYLDMPGEVNNIKDIECIGDHIYLIDDGLNKVIQLDKHKLLDEEKVFETGSYDTGFASSATLGAVNINSNDYIVINDYIFSGHLFFCSIRDLSVGEQLVNQAKFKIKSEFYIKNIFSDQGQMYLLANKIGKDLIYIVDTEKAVLKGKLQDGISKIIKAPDSDLKGISLVDDRIITYGSRNKKIFIEK
ncbi:MAG: CDP-alcohol phosphatidyltransferase family protein [Candidatus Delongbacteria bacterium]